MFNPAAALRRRSFAKKMAPTRCRATSWAGTCRPSSAALTLGIPISAKNKALGADWIKAFTSTASETIIAKAGNIANTTKLANVNAKNPALAPFARASKYSWFVPTAPNWVNVENSHLLKQMLTAILTNKKSVQAAAHGASKQITTILNASS